MVGLLVVVAVVLGVNLMPVLAPPTWAVLVYFRFRYPELAAPALILAGATAATAGRVLLAIAFRAFGARLPAARRESLQVLGRTVAGRRAGLVAAAVLFALSPLPSAQLFEAVGLAKVRLAPLAAAFFLGRLVSYSIYIGASSAAHASLSRVFARGLLSPPAIVTELAGIALLVAVVLVDWPTAIDRGRAWWAARHGRPAPPSIRGGC